MKEIAIIFRDRKKDFWNKISREVKDVFEYSKVSCFWKNSLKEKNLQNKELIISIGGDGTFLSASHFVKNQTIIGINSNKKRSEGVLTSESIENLKAKLKKIKEGKFRVKEYKRVKAKIFQKDKCILTEYALNEVYVGNVNPHHTSKYTLLFKGKKENQVSSGILISTGTGSSAWYKSMGGKPFSKTKNFLKFIVREPYSRKIHKTKIKKGKIKEKEVLEIKNFFSHNILAIDSIRSYKLKKGDKVILSIGKPIKIIQ